MSKIKKSNTNGLVKCAVAGVTLMLCMSMFPVNAVNALADALVDSSVANGQNAITLNASRTEKTVKKGDTYYIPAAKFVNAEGSSTSIPKSDVKVTMKGSTKTEKILDVTEIETPTDFVGMFTPSNVGTYVISYSATYEGKTYTYDYEIECVVSDATFEFDTNSSNIIPSVYDIALLEEKGMIDSATGAGPDIVLPLPSVNDANGDKIDGVTYSTARPTTGSEGKVIVVRLSNASSSIEIKPRQVGEGDAQTTEYYIDGAELTAKNGDNELSAVGVYDIVYTYYENGVFVAQTSQQFEVSDSYYQNTDEEPGYDLAITWDSSKPTSAVTGVELELPSVSGTSRNTSETYDIPVYFTISVRHHEDGVWVDRTTECLDSENQRLFTPFADGDYIITYTVRDFYGNTVDVANSQFEINGVKDTQNPTVLAYDANEDYATETVDGEEKYVDARTKMKSRTVNRNMIIYAVGGEDNVGVTNLRREIRDSGTTTRITIEDYDDKNLVFNLSTQPGSTSVTSAYVQLVNDNEALRQEMLADSVEITNEDQIKTWLIGHNYLIVTNSYTTNPVTNEAFELTDTEGNPITTDSSSDQFSIEAVKDALVREGFAYIDYSYTFTSQNYRIQYIAEDAAGNKTTESYQMYITTQDDYTDEALPTVTFSTSLQSTYLPDDIIEFSAPTASDTTDSYPTLVFGYRFLDSGRNGLTPEGSQNLSFYVNENTARNSNIPSNVWYGGGAGTKSSDGWFILEQEEEDQTFSIDLAQKPAGSAYVEIFAYATDDYGNMGFYRRVVTIASQNDSDPLDLHSVTGYTDENNGGDGYKANSEITLPTLTYTDDMVEYMTASVHVYYFVETEVPGEGEDDPATTVVTKKELSSANMTTEFDTIRGVYVVNAGSFMASRAGSYQVVVVARDAGNNSIATFFDFEIKSVDYIGKPVIDNISSETIDLDIGEEHYLETPTLSITENKTYSYWGINREDDSNAAMYYTTKMLTAENNNYDLTKYHFVANASGLYTMQYEIQLIQYNNDLFSETPADGMLSLDEKGRLVYYTGGTAAENRYYILFNGEEDEQGNPKIVASRDLVDLTTNTTAVPEGVTGILLTSDPQTFSVGQLSAPVITVDDDAFLSSNIVSDGEDGQRIAIPRITGTVDGDGYVDQSSSRIEISVERGSGTTTLATIYGDKYEQTNGDNATYDAENDVVWLNLNYNGTYTIKYTAQAATYNGEPVGDPATKTFTLAYGDVQRPTITVEDGFLNKVADEYARGDELILDISKLTFHDNVTSVDKLKEKLTITVTNTDTDTALENQGEGTNYVYNLESAGEYEITITVKDEAGWTAERTVTVTVATDASNANEIYKTVGIVFIVISVVVLAGVVTYFVVSKVKLDKKTKGKNKKK